MNDMTRNALASDTYLRDGGYDFGARRNRRLADPLFDHYCAEADASTYAPMLTEADVDALAARDAERQELERVEGRILVPRSPAHINPHD